MEYDWTVPENPDENGLIPEPTGELEDFIEAFFN